MQPHQLKRDATLSRSSLNTRNTLGKIALNVRVVRLFATKFVSNESWIVSEYTYRSETQEGNSFEPAFQSPFRSVFFRNMCGQLPRHRRHRFMRHQERNVASPYLPKYLLFTSQFIPRFSHHFVIDEVSNGANLVTGLVHIFKYIHVVVNSFSGKF